MAPVLARAILRQAARTAGSGVGLRVTASRVLATSLRPYAPALVARALIPQFASYATATKKKAAPKKASTTTRKASTGGRKKATTAVAKKKTASGTKKKAAATKKKAASTTAASRKRKKPGKVADPEKAAARKLREMSVKMKQQALPNEPKKRALVPYAHFIAKTGKDQQGTTGRELLGKVLKQYQDLTPAEKEALRAETKKLNDQRKRAYEAWVEKYTPDEIRAANTARRWLIKHDKATKQFSHLIADHRRPKKALTPFLFFLKAQRLNQTSPQPLAESAKVWKAMPASQKKEFQDLSEANKKVYKQAWEQYTS